jgi:VIT1/CCC1 family predicted Fe2+/Mn2+ transporter
MPDAVPAGPNTDPGDQDEVELRKEACTMALYVAICLRAALSAVSEHGGTDELDAFKIVWGTTVGLAVAHWFAFRVSARLVASGTIRRHDAEAAGAQVAGAVAVALLATVPVLFLPKSVELDVARLVLAGFIAIIGYAVARSSGGTRGRSLVYAASILVVAALVAVVKNVLAGH